MSQNGQKKAIPPTPQLHITVLFPKKISSLLKIFSLFHLAIWSTFCNAIGGYLSRFKFKNPVNSSFYKIESLRRKERSNPFKSLFMFHRSPHVPISRAPFFPPLFETLPHNFILCPSKAYLLFQGHLSRWNTWKGRTTIWLQLFLWSILY